ncbi:polysaccharide deacetylase family protein [Clostridium saccharobutylicum]|uniref:Putative polysaccharide deacetylase YxkH n=1 Tax=Clostridium saccharobutylicum DSM 13864 TaxID=1345695 RepID=U5MXU3_CLOSA|nr:polysaccharide deacetylase family protein [Clostridium saccharobutylicum]AGX44431.1 putative polysaccharide deacetylase YxkH [Clostridium saccharobutylicum DSM 13864]AQR91725.1 poly-beta-1,6-N-acetyl-D-glucosamine N-deacetylase precursor [Clostridium saccharobutylicum]AQS01627.1 poly-beta-1,6-N-acetyl-D-glucosamine N-deacetylase precursor [Clostridium saccharobutylicum]AQS15610.1 poly-beta-1,6-N-acetyl-D-glucosamine N-deacetylase precursor [Clostridium saccharobutylicum]MBA2907661.1 peptido
MKKLVTLVLFLFILTSTNVVAFANSTPKIPVLLYHVVTQNPSGTYQFSLTDFKNDMAYLKKNGYTPLSLNQYYNILNGTVTAPSRPVLLTFDDSTSDFYTNVYPVLKQYNFKATQFAVTDWLDTNGHLTRAQLQMLSANGIDIANHTIKHQPLTSDWNTQYSAINNANIKLKSITNNAANSVAYPYGNYNSTTMSVLKNLGCQGGFTVSGGLSSSNSNKYELPRIIMANGDSVSVFARKLTTGY